jgi:predicted MFS family arabinose efflux permease
MSDSNTYAAPLEAAADLPARRGANESAQAAQREQPAQPAHQIRHWPAVLSVALSAAAFCTTEFMPVGLLRYIADGLAVSDGAAGLTVTAPGLLAAVAAPAVTVLVRRQDRRIVLWALGVLLVLANVIAALAPGFPVLIAARVLFGIGLGGFWALGAGLGERLVDRASAPKATALIFAGVSVGMLVGGAAGALIGELLGWRWAFGITAGLAALSLAAQLASLPRLAVDRQIAVRDLFGLFATPCGRNVLITMTLGLLGQFAAYTYITPFLSRHAHFGGETISALLLGYTLIGLLGNFVGGALAARHARATLAAAIGLIGVPLLLLPWCAHAPLQVVLLLALWGIAYGSMPVVLQVALSEAAPRSTEGSMALFVANFQISIALGAWAGGCLVDRVGIGSTMFTAAGLCAAALAALALRGLRR